MPTHTADYKYIVKELPAHTPEGATHQNATWALECSPESQQLPFIGSTGCMYINMKPGTTEEQAKKIADLLNEHASEVRVLT